MYCSHDPFLTSYIDFLLVKREDKANCTVSLEDLLLIPTLLIFILFCSLTVFFWIHQFYFRKSVMETMMFNMYLSQEGKNLCRSCLQKNKKYNGFIDEHQYTFKMQKGDCFRIKMFNDFSTESGKPHISVCNQNPEALIVHDCGGLQKIEFEMLSFRPQRLLCLPSVHYCNVVVVEYEYGILDVALSKLKIMGAKIPKHLEMLKKKQGSNGYLLSDYFLNFLDFPPQNGVMYYYHGEISIGRNDYNRPQLLDIEETAISGACLG